MLNHRNASRTAWLLVAAACATATAGVSARAGDWGTKAAYARADALAGSTRDTVFKARVRPEWTADGRRLWYRNDLAEGGREYVAVNAENGERRPAFDHGKLAEDLGKAAGKPLDPAKLLLDRFAIGDDGVATFAFEGKPYRLEPSGELKDDPAPPAEKPAEAGPDGDRRRRWPRPGEGTREAPRGEDSPDGKFAVVARDHNLILRTKADGREVRLSFEGSDVDSYDPRVFWSPDSKRFVALRTRKGSGHKVHMVASSPKDQVQPRLVTHDYLKPGDQVDVSKPHLFDVEAGKEIPIDPELAPNPWSVEGFAWNADSSRFSFLYNQRGHQVMRLIAVDSTSASRWCAGGRRR